MKNFTKKWAKCFNLLASSSVASTQVFTLHQVTRQVATQASHLGTPRPPAPPAPNHLKGPHLLVGDIKPLCWAPPYALGMVPKPWNSAWAE